MRFRASEIVTLSAAGVALLGTLANAIYTYTARSRELDIRLIEIGIAILRTDPKEEQTNGAREWAVDIIEQYSGRKFKQEARDQLLQHQLGWVDTGYYDVTEPKDVFRPKNVFPPGSAPRQ